MLYLEDRFKELQAKKEWENIKALVRTSLSDCDLNAILRNTLTLKSEDEKNESDFGQRKEIIDAVIHILPSRTSTFFERLLNEALLRSQTYPINKEINFYFIKTALEKIVNCGLKPNLEDAIKLTYKNGDLLQPGENKVKEGFEHLNKALIEAQAEINKTFEERLKEFSEEFNESIRTYNNIKAENIRQQAFSTLANHLRMQVNENKTAPLPFKEWKKAPIFSKLLERPSRWKWLSWIMKFFITTPEVKKIKILEKAYISGYLTVDKINMEVGKLPVKKFTLSTIDICKKLNLEVSPTKDNASTQTNSPKSVDALSMNTLSSSSAVSSPTQTPQSSPRRTP